MYLEDPAAGHDTDLGYHARMVGDPHRMTAYERALRALVRPGMRVLDVGAGTGVLSLWAARLGATVTAVESMRVANIARALVARNGLAHRVKVIEADLRDLSPEPVDLIVSDCLGRFLVDDGMIPVMEAAMRWLVPGGHVVPADVELVVAPVAMSHLQALDAWDLPALGLDLGPVARFLEHQTHGVLCRPEQVLSEPRRFATWRPGVSHPFDERLRFRVERAGRLRGLAGWFVADLAPGVRLSTAPGLETHWNQLLFPLPAREVVPGDTLEVHLRRRTDTALGWAWTARLVRAGVEETLTGSDEPIALEGPFGEHTAAAVDPNEAHARAVAAWQAGDHALAADWFGRAAAAMDPHAPAGDAAIVWENAGIGYHAAGRFQAAIVAFLRALDGDPTSREQSLRLLVDACRRGGRVVDAEHYEALYTGRFGPLPA